MNRDRLFSPLGDSRPRATRCTCGRETWAWDATCDRCHERERDRLDDAERHDGELV